MKEKTSVVAETFIKTLKNNIYKHMTTVPKNVYIDELNDRVDVCNKTYNRTIKTNHIYVIYEIIIKIPEVRISKFKKNSKRLYLELVRRGFC